MKYIALFISEDEKDWKSLKGDKAKAVRMEGVNEEIDVKDLEKLLHIVKYLAKRIHENL